MIYFLLIKKSKHRLFLINGVVEFEGEKNQMRLPFFLLKIDRGKNGKNKDDGRNNEVAIVIF